MNYSLVSIIIPTYNRAHLIRETLDSIVNQTYQNWECIIVDDGSTDDTEEVVQEYTNQDNRFWYYHRPFDKPKGGNSCRNYGFEKSKGEYIKWFDSDDIMYSNFLEKQVDILQTNTNLDFCACQWEYFEDNLSSKKNYINLKPNNHPIYSYFLEGHVFATPSPLWNRLFLERKDLFDLKLFRSQEADFHFRMLTFSPNYLLHEDFLYKVRRGHDSIESLSSNTKSQLSVLRYFQKAFTIVSKMHFEQREKLLKYLIFRITSQTYTLIILENSLFKRLKYLDIYKYLIVFYKYLSIKDFLKLFIGFNGLILFRKGYTLISLKKFDYRKLETSAILNFII